MKKLIIVLLVNSFILALPNVALAKENYNRQTWFNNFTDFFATMGKDPKTSKEIIKHRKKIRRQTRQLKHKMNKDVRTQQKIKKEQDALRKKLHLNSGKTRIGN